MGGYRFGDDHAVAGRSCLRSIDLDRHQMLGQCALQRGEPKDTYGDRPQTPDFTQVPRGRGKTKSKRYCDQRAGKQLNRGP